MSSLVVSLLSAAVLVVCPGTLAGHEPRQGNKQEAALGVTAASENSAAEFTGMVKKGLCWTEKPVEFKDGPAILRGTIFIPDGESDVPGVLILGGSERGPRTRLKERLAEHFARAGVAALIYDSAGTGQSTGNALFQTRDARAEEAIAAFHCLQSEIRTRPAQVGILGISEGALEPIPKPFSVLFV